MEVIQHLLQLEMEDGNYVYVNTLQGAVDIMTKTDHQIIQEWQKNASVELDTPYSKEIYEHMNRRGYIVKDRAEEEQILAATFQKLQSKLKESQEKVSQIRLVLTYDCNFRCVYCYEDHVQKNGHDWVEKTMIKEQVDRIKARYQENLKWVTLFGGEPLLLKNRELVEYILNTFENVTFGVTTNGYTLEEYVPLLTKYNFGIVEITLDGPAEIHNQRRFLANGAGTYDKVMRGVDAAVKCGLPVQLRMTIDETNFDACSQLFRELGERYQDYPNFKIFRNAVFSKNGSKTCRSEIFTQLFAEEEKMVNSKLARGIQTFHPIAQAFENAEDWEPQYTFCAAHRGQLFFDPHGDIYTCWLALGQKDLIVGTYDPQEVMNAKLPWFERTMENMTPCNQCPNALLCGGGCAKAVYTQTGDLMAHNCTQTRFVIDKVIPHLYKKYVLGLEREGEN